MKGYKIRQTKNFIKQIIKKDLENNTCNQIRTRFPPEPNGYLHIGHAKSICLNFGVAEEYQGVCNLRFDDTNPENSTDEYVKSIQKDLKWLGFTWGDQEYYASEYFEELYQYAVKLVKKGLAYVDELSPEDIRKYRGTLNKVGINSPYRDRDIQENLNLFQKMRDGKFKPGNACLRAKIDMKSPSIIMRDPILYRIKFKKHHRTGYKWCVYPMYDWTHCISDALEGITHSICTLEFQENRSLYNWILENIRNNNKNPKQYEFSRLNLEYSVMSKRKLSTLVTTKCVSGWDDPRMPTLSGLRRRGYTATSIRNFCNLIGVTKQDSFISISRLESCIREELNDNAPRVMAVIDPVKVIIQDYSPNKIEHLIMANHPSKLEMGSRKVPFTSDIWIDRSDFRETANAEYKRLTLGKEVRLRHSYIIKAISCKKDNTGNIIAIFCTHDKYTLNKNPKDGRKVKGIIHWVSVTHAVPVEVRLYDYLFNIPYPDSVKDFVSQINTTSLVVKQGYGELKLKEAKKGDTYQFEREGYFCRDTCTRKKNKIIFNLTVKLRNSKKKDT